MMQKTEKHQPPKRTRRKLLLKLSLVWLILIIFGAVASGMLIQYGLQSGSIVLNFLTEKSQQQLNETPLQLTKIRSESLGYELIYNPQIFKPDRATNISESNLAEIGLTTQETIQTGFGVILFNAYSSDELNQITNATSGEDQLEKAANWYQQKRLRDLTDTSSYVGKERIQRWGTDSYRLDYKRQVFGEDVYHFVYLTIKNNKLYTVLADYPKQGVSESIVESWIDEIAFIGPNAPEVQAETTAKKLDLDEVKLVELNKPSVVQIVSVNCVTININDLSKVENMKPSYEICNGGSGTGFLVGKDGLVATNGHVAKVSFADLVYSGRPEPGNGEFYADFQKFLNTSENGSGTAVAQSVSKTPANLDAIIQKYAEFEEDGIFSKQFSDKYFVKLGNDPIKFAKAANSSSFSYKNLQPIERTSTVLDAEYVASDFAGITALSQAAIQNASGRRAVERTRTSDVALIKLKSEPGIQFPGLPMISSSDVKEGQQILVVGFPGLVSGQDAKTNFLLDETISSVRPTITRGIISAVKQDTFGQILLQTDASIEHGNSGGPAFSYVGDVLGIATYVISSGSGNYNFLRSTDDLFNLLEANGGNKDEVGSSYTAWKQGLTYFWEGRFTKAKAEFIKVKELYPIHPQADEYIQTADQGIKDGQDTDLNGGVDLKSFGYTQQQITLFIAVIMTVLIIVGGIITTYFIYDHRKNMNVVIALPASAVQPPQKPNNQ